MAFATRFDSAHVSFVSSPAIVSPASGSRASSVTLLSRACREKIFSTLGTTFRNNLQADTNDLAVSVKTAEELAGMPTDAIAAAADSAKARGLDGYLITLVLPSRQPALSVLTDRALRERLHRAAVSRGRRDNKVAQAPAPERKRKHGRQERNRDDQRRNHAEPLVGDAAEEWREHEPRAVHGDN